MSILNTVIFIDGRNFRYNLREFRFQSTKKDKDGKLIYKYPYRLDEKHFQWEAFFEGILDKFNEATQRQHRLIRAYWYSAETIRPFEISERQIQEILKNYQSEYKDLSGEIIITLAKEWWERERTYFENTRQKIFEGIQRRVDFLEFKYTGEYVVHPFRVYKLFKNKSGNFVYFGQKKGEKGVDVGISVDMVAKMPNYDVAILVSGDADFRPVVQYVKDGLKCVYQFSISQGIPPEIRYLSPWLIGEVDIFQFYDELELLEKYLDRKSRIPPAILGCIDNRIKQLKKQATKSS